MHKSQLKDRGFIRRMRSRRDSGYPRTRYVRAGVEPGSSATPKRRIPHYLEGAVREDARAGPWAQAGLWMEGVRGR